MALVNFFCTAYMTGVIWVIQRVNYPGYQNVSCEDFTKFQDEHIKHITPVVAPAMILELFTSFFLIIALPDYLNNLANFYILLSLFFLNLFIWLVTIFFSIPLHHKIKEKKDEKKIKLLVKTNWLRTLAWSSRSVLWLILLSRLLTHFTLN